MIQVLINICNFVLIFLIGIRSSDDIQFRRQMSSLTNLLGNVAPSEFKDRFDKIILIFVLIWIFLHILILKLN